MKWFNYVLNFIGKFFNDAEEEQDKDYHYIEQKKETEISIPDTPLFHVLFSLFESFQLYILDPFIVNLQRESLENSVIEFLFFWFPYVYRFFQNLIDYVSKIKYSITEYIYHPLDRKGFLYNVGKNIKKAYEMSSSKFKVYFHFVHKDEELKEISLTIDQRDRHTIYSKLHKEALHFWIFHEMMIRPVYFLLKEIELLQEWILFKSLNSFNQSDLILMWKKWDKRKRKLEISIRNDIFDLHHERVNSWIKSITQFIGYKELKPHEYYVHLYQAKIMKDKESLMVGKLNFEFKNTSISWLQKEILSRIVLKRDIYSFLKREHHPDFIKIISKEHTKISQIVDVYTLLKKEILYFRNQLYNLRLWYSYYVINDLTIFDFYNKWKEINLILQELTEQLEISYIKQLKSSENQKKDIQTRIYQTLKNKIVRKSIQGVFFDQTVDLVKFNQEYQETKKPYILLKMKELNGLYNFYKEIQHNMKVSTLSKKKSFQVLNNYF